MSKMRIIVKSKRWIEPEGAWVVDIFCEDRILASDIKVEESITDKERKDIRWHIESFVRENPYAVTRAAAARTVLEGYGYQLLEQLHLRELLIQENEQPQITIEIVDADGESAAPTIHRLQWELLEHPLIWKHPHVTVTVKRSVAEKTTGETTLDPGLTLPVAGDAAARNTVNVLLVVARDLTPNSAVYNDIPPFYVTRDIDKSENRGFETEASNSAQR
jgi:hypothetical protein